MQVKTRITAQPVRMVFVSVSFWLRKGLFCPLYCLFIYLFIYIASPGSYVYIYIYIYKKTKGKQSPCQIERIE